MAFPKKKNSSHAHTKLSKFSALSWQELEDIYPGNLRVSSEVCNILSVVFPAWTALSHKYKFKVSEVGARPGFRLRDLLLLFWIQRCEDAKGGVATQGYTISKPLSWNQRMRSMKQSPLHRLKLVENMPYKKLHLYRVTAKGKLVMRDFVEMLEQAHKDVRYFSSIQPEENQKYTDNIMRRYFALGGLFVYEDIETKL